MRCGPAYWYGACSKAEQGSCRCKCLLAGSSPYSFKMRVLAESRVEDRYQERLNGFTRRRPFVRPGLPLPL